MLALLAAAPCAAEKDSVVRLTKYNFAENVKQGSWFVKFYAPWCVHCKKLAPIWEKLADQAEKKNWPVKIAEVDCTQSKDICESVRVKAFPTLGLITGGELKERYKGEATIEQFESFLNDQQVMGTPGAEKGGKSSDEAAKKGKLDDAMASKGSQGTGQGASGSSASAGRWDVRTVGPTFPTSSRILNIYIWCCAALVALIAVLCALSTWAVSDDDEREHRE